MRAAILTNAVMASLASLGAGGSGSEPGAGRMLTSDAAARVVHRFDFDERDEGNLEALPKYWAKIRPEGFPQYTGGGFDFGVGHAAPPSFRLDGRGRSAAYAYTGPETRVHTDSDYRIEGYIRPGGLVHARACLSAHFVDKHGRPIPNTLVRSQYVGGSDTTDGWEHVELYLPSAPAAAFSIGLVAWVLQESEWRTEPLPPWHVPRVDVAGAAWFDDVTIYRLPRAEIRCAALGNVIGPDDEQSIKVLLVDHDDVTLDGRLSILDADGGVVETHIIPVDVARGSQPIRIDVSSLAPGLYRAHLEVFSDQRRILERTLTFARLAETHQPDGALARSFGVVLDPADRADSDVELALLSRQGVHAAKIPAWGGGGNEPGARAERHPTYRFLQQLVNRGFVLTGVFGEPPATLARGRIPENRRLIELLNDDPGLWQPYVASTVAPNASAFRWWQLGRDGVAFPPSLDAAVASALVHLREVMKPYLNVPRLAVPELSGIAAGRSDPPVEQVCVTVAQSLSLTRFPELVRHWKQSGHQRVSVYVEPLDANSYDRESRLARSAQRLIAARHAGADTVFVPQTWNVQHTPRGTSVEPDETFVLMRTLATTIGDAEPMAAIEFGDGIRAFSFRRSDGPQHRHDARSLGRNISVLALWDENAGQSYRRHALELGGATAQLDLWGRAFEIPRDDHGRQVVTLSQMPVLVLGANPLLLDLRRALSLTPSRVASGREAVSFTLALVYRGPVPLSGTVTLEGPEGWDFTPHRQGFTVMPQRTERLAFRGRIPHTEPAGVKQVLARLKLTEGGYHLDVPLAVDVGLDDVGVSGMAVLEGSVLYLRQVITNNSSKTLSFRAAATVPGRERQYRPLANLLPGETRTAIYRIPDAVDLVARKIRLGLYELGDRPRVHTLELTVP